MYTLINKRMCSMAKWQTLLSAGLSTDGRLRGSSSAPAQGEVRLSRELPYKWPCRQRQANSSLFRGRHQRGLSQSQKQAALPGTCTVWAWSLGSRKSQRITKCHKKALTLSMVTNQENHVTTFCIRESFLYPTKFSRTRGSGISQNQDRKKISKSSELGPRHQ